MILWLESRLDRGKEEIQLIRDEMSATYLHYQKRQVAYLVWHRELCAAARKMVEWSDRAEEAAEVRAFGPILDAFWKPQTAGTTASLS